MIEIKFTIRPFIKSATNQVAIRVMWNSQCEVTFVTGVWADKKKWDSDRQKAKKMTTHVVKSKLKEHTCTSQEINERIAQYREEIEHAFYVYSLKGSIPTSNELKEMVNAGVGRSEKSKDDILKPPSLDVLLESFLNKGSREKNWDDNAREKYIQAFNNFVAANPRLKAYNITIDSMYRLRDWFVDNDYRNRTINKQFVMLKAFLKYLNEQDNIEIPQNVLNFETNFKVVKRTVTFMKYEELLKFTDFQFTRCSERLSRVRDLWCFMAYTSLRYSDLARLRRIHIVDGKRIEMLSEKTDEHLSIPLVEGALKIIKRRGGCFGEDGLLFDVPSNMQMNMSIKDAAKEAGINRKIIDAYFIGTKRYEEVHEFCDIIGCHDARRTFVSNSLAMGIPPQVVMKCTGHTGYATMKPYIDTATETQAVEMEKWNVNQYRSQIVSLLDKANEKELEDIFYYIQKRLVVNVEVVDTVDCDALKIQDENASDSSIEDEKHLMRIPNVKKDKDDDFANMSIQDAIASGRLFHIDYEIEQA